MPREVPSKTDSMVLVAGASPRIHHYCYTVKPTSKAFSRYPTTPDLSPTNT